MQRLRGAASSRPRAGGDAQLRLAPAALHTGGAGVMALSPAPPTPSFSSAARVTSSVLIAARPADVFRFHADARNLPRVTPGPVRVRSAARTSERGDLQVIELGRPPLMLRWHARIVYVEPPRQIIDVQEQGPFRLWQHTHTVEAVAGGARLEDMVEFRLTPGPAGRAVDALVVAPLLRVLFAVRQRRTRRLLEGRGAAR